MKGASWPNHSAWVLLTIIMTIAREFGMELKWSTRISSVTFLSLGLSLAVLVTHQYLLFMLIQWTTYLSCTICLTASETVTSRKNEEQSSSRITQLETELRCLREKEVDHTEAVKAKDSQVRHCANVTRCFISTSLATIVEYWTPNQPKLLLKQ